MYYLVDWRIDEEAQKLNLADIDFVPDMDIPWTMGVFWDEPIEQPVELTIDPDSGKDIPDAFFTGVPLFSTRLLGLLTNAGVDNLQVYDAIVKDPRNNKIYANYKAVNIVGLVACANLEKSRYSEGSGPPLMHFDQLIIDEQKTTGMKIFRLAESAGVILVNEKIAKTLLDSNLTGVRILQVGSN